MADSASLESSLTTAAGSLYAGVSITRAPAVMLLPKDVHKKASSIESSQTKIIHLVRHAQGK